MTVTVVPSLGSDRTRRWPPTSSAIVGVEDSYTFVPLDRPERLTELVVDFARARTTA